LPITDCALSLSCYGARVVVVDHTGSHLLPRLAEFLPGQARVGETTAPDVEYEVRAQAPDHLAEARVWEVTRNGELRFRAATPEGVLRWLRSDLDHQVAIHARDGLFVHAGVVGWRGHAILVPGRSMTGKSTLVAELVRRGAIYYSDEYAVIDDWGRVHAYTRPLSLRGDSGSSQSTPRHQSTGPTTGPEPLPATLVVSAAYQSGASWCPAVVTGARAALALIDNSVLAATEPTRTLRMAAMLGPGVVMLQGVRPDAELVAPEILRFIDDLLDGREVSGGRMWGAGYNALPVRLRAGASDGSGRADAPSYRARHLRIEGVLESRDHARLLEYAGGHEPDFQPGKVFTAGSSWAGMVDPEVRRARDKKMLDAVWDLFDRRLRDLLPDVRRTLGIPWFPLAGIERRLVVHADGDFFGVHTDNGRPAVSARRITAVYYFHATPKRFSGGELRLYDGVLQDGRVGPGTTYTKLEPLDNSLVFFPSQLFHEVRPVQANGGDFRDGRFTVNMWYLAVEPPCAPDSVTADS
jgi:predicted 2-oxoglutarate/Fe(II)-dependent dioxygenase YbiX